MLAILRVLNQPLNPRQVKALSYAIVKDESHNFSLDTYYIRPKNRSIEQHRPVALLCLYLLVGYGNCDLGEFGYLNS
jgi:hypothetical protein